ncbi:hypothetical protein DAPPUDRAFT_336709 [Daphnia pulex]|uniref:Integrase catalytic domain-containing protein n=1 Tax=Daphnia pulex TaxID=6669 RepID=E9I070_DAPPU|nr:hypothetical protein DAPPUDRAFT_336709 [Daphnia pulex]|eukprot:EFX62609.1 hypothetical protein DAPPUDRAFT_336709 [Daphnia pulex]
MPRQQTKNPKKLAIDGKKKRKTKEVEVSSEEEDFSQTEDEGVEEIEDNNYSPNSSEIDDGSDSESSGEEEEMDGENATNAKGETSLLEKLEADRKRKITPIKIKKLAMKKQKLEKKEKPKTPRKKKEKKVESMDLSSSAQPELVNPSPPTSSSTEVVAQSSTNNNMDATPPAQSLQDVGKQAATNIAVDVLEGKNIKESAQEQLDEAKKKIASTLRGSGACRKLYSEEDAYGTDLTDPIECEKDLEHNYNFVGHPVAFSGITNIYKYYKGILSIDKIKDILSRIENYTLHREYKKGQRNTSFSHFKRYIMTVIDTFTRYAFCRLLLDKRADTVLNAFQSVLKEAKEKPKILVVDRGGEYHKILRIIPIRESKTGYIISEFKHKEFHELQNTEIRELEIELRAHDD